MPRPVRHLIDVTSVLAGVTLALLAYAFLAPLPDPRGQLPHGGTVVVAADGTILWRDTAEGVRIPVALDQVSPAIVQATIAAEDQRFRSHPGVDPLAVARAMVRFPWERSGASTITQQLARRLYLGDEDSLLLRKAREAEIATQLEARLSKDEILELYLNAVYYGRGAYGVEAAARVYFGVSAANLDVARAAFLAGLPQSPGIGDDAGRAAWERQRYVLDRMQATGAITTSEREAALSSSIGVLPAAAPPVAAQFVAFAREEAERLVPGITTEDGLVIETTLESGLQAEAERQARLQLDRLERNEAHNAAVVVLDPRDGRILAMAGNVTARAEGADYNMAIVPRQPGSALKPFLYSLALERGYTAASPLLDVPSTFSSAGGAYAPQNYDLRFRGVVTLRTALASSLNVPAVGMADALGTDAFFRQLRKFGLTTIEDPGRHDLALALGSGEVSLLQLTAAYGALAAQGGYLEPFAVTRILDSNGRVLYERPRAVPRRVVSPEIAYIISDILSDPAARTPGFGPSSILELPFPAAVKTGTTTDFHDNWTVGYTPRQVVGVWVGNVDNRAMHDVSGVDGAAPIWVEVMKEARRLQGGELFTPPAGLVRGDVCAPTGLRPGPDCPSVSKEWFIAGTEPAGVEHYYLRNEDGQTLIDPPVVARAWMADGGYALAEAGPGDSGEIAIAQPADGAVLFLAPELARQELAIRLGCPAGITGIAAFIDGVAVASAASCSDQIVVPLTAGPHQLRVEAHTGGGEVIHARSTFEVRKK